MRYLIYQNGALADTADTESEAMHAADQLHGTVEIFVCIATLYGR